MLRSILTSACQTFRSIITVNHSNDLWHDLTFMFVIPETVYVDDWSSYTNKTFLQVVNRLCRETEQTAIPLRHSIVDRK